MASLLLRRKKFWVQYFVPGQSAPRRRSLGTGDPAAATLIKEKMEHLLALSEPRLLGVEIPAAISLTLPGADVTSIAFALGFSSSQYFASAFRRFTNMSPRGALRK